MKNISKNYISIFSAIIFLFTLTSCEKEIDVDLRSVDPKIVIEGIVVKDSLAQVRITKTKDFNTDNEFPPVYGAIVTISDDEGNTEVLTQNNNGLYVAKNLRGKENRLYTLNVLVEDQEFTSSSRMPAVVPIDSIKMYNIPSFGYYVPMVVFKDPAGIENYYRNKLYMNGVRMKIGNEATDTKQRDGVLVERILPVFDDEKVDSRKVEKGDTILVELQSIDEGAYKYFDTLGNMDSSQNNPTSNITGGALGYFSAYSFDRMQVIADW